MTKSKPSLSKKPETVTDPLIDEEVAKMIVAISEPDVSDVSLPALYEVPTSYTSDERNTYYVTVNEANIPWSISIAGQKFRGFLSPNREKTMWRIPQASVSRFEMHHFFVSKIVARV